MAPACVATIFEGDNGGATSRGVSNTEIRVGIAVPAGFNGSSATNNVTRDAITALFEHFNRRFELYGRRLVPVYVEGTASEPLGARTQGAELAAKDLFAALTGYQEFQEGNSVRSVQLALVQELARNQIVTITRNAGLGWSDRLMFDSLHPYAWSIYPSAETNLANLADFTCASLVGHTASLALDATLQGQARRFGVLAMGRHSAPSVRTLVDTLTACDRDPVVVQWASASDPNGTALRTGLSQLQAAGVTSIVCACESVSMFSPGISTANSISYRPEWITLPSPWTSDEQLAQPGLYPAGYIRLDSGPRLLPMQSRSWFRAILETNPTMFTRDASTTRAAFDAAQVIYDGLLALAAGIQGAGPALTADSFAQALMSTTFPNPGAGAPPYWQPSAGFGPGDHAFYDDYAIARWSATTPSVEPHGLPFGSWCYLGAGSRFRAGSYPANASARLADPGERCQ